MYDPYPLALETCQRCPRLAAYRAEVAQTKRRAYRGESYWGKPVPGFGDPQARILLLGLAPGAHGSNRTGRMFTGDASGAFLYPALYRMGLSNQEASHGRNDGLVLHGVFISAAARCVPPANKPTPQEVRTCRSWLKRDLEGLCDLKLVIALGRVAHEAYLELLKEEGVALVKKHYPFAHGAFHTVAGAPPLLDSYHVSFQNTNTGKLTPEMFDAVLTQAKTLAGLGA